MASRKKSPRPATVKPARTVETAYPFQLKVGHDYRVVFRNGNSAVYDGAALAANPHVPVAEMMRVYDESTGERVYLG